MIFYANQRLVTDGENMRIQAVCRECQKVFTSAPVTRGQIARLMAGEHVQDVLPTWSPGDRELFVLTGVCDACWCKMFAEQGEDE